MVEGVKDFLHYLSEINLKLRLKLKFTLSHVHNAS